MCEDFLLPLLRWLGFKDVGLVFGWLVRDKKSCGCILIFFLFYKTSYRMEYLILHFRLPFEV